VPELREEITGGDDLFARSLLNSSSESGLVGGIELESLGAFRHEHHNHCSLGKLPSGELDAPVADGARGYYHSVMLADCVGPACSFRCLGAPGVVPLKRKFFIWFQVDQVERAGATLRFGERLTEDSKFRANGLR